MIFKGLLLFSTLIAANAGEFSRLYKRGLPDGAVANKCPPDWNDPHCSCDINYLSLTTTITCHDVNGVDQLKKSLEIKWKNRNYEWLVLQNVKLESFPEDTLNNMTFIGFIFHNVTLRNLDSKAFEGSSASAEYLWASESNFSNFNFNALKPLSKLRSLAIMSSHLKEIPSEAFKGLVHLEVINVERNGITKIGPNTFADLPQLRRLELTSNNMTSLENGTLNTSGSLRDVVILLSENKISEISAGAFDGLKTINIHLERNRLSTLNSDAFSHLLHEMTKYGKGRLFVRDNPFDCNKSLDWLKEKPEYLDQIVGLPCLKKNDLFSSGP